MPHERDGTEDDAYLDIDGLANAEADGENDGYGYLAGGGAGAEKGDEMGVFIRMRIPV